MQGMAPEEQVLNNTTEESRVAHGRFAPRRGEKAAGDLFVSDFLRFVKGICFACHHVSQEFAIG